ncbi:Gfo/Idh/MocA family protein [Succinivibrio dextrinosolvens]|uniref:Predicted dehydrogenase n=1 Tax=Succinivibrio dextrinosolvens TaxID=83771 RepID=A0A662ZEB5_9GAMM|nr:Gfo/Idh/MocA family oxidoreductase [Succinivibrio dextrinosolvens]SFK46139.1 Predicted dehydrogenase [Succinivibrio dextrinosolvens]
MKFVVVGCGSMGRRRIRLLKKISSAFQIVAVDSNKERQNKVRKEFAIETFDSIESVFDCFTPDCAVISTPPLSHSSLIESCLNHNCHVFTELNLVSDNYKNNIALAELKNRVLFLSSTFLYRDEICYIQNKIQCSNSPVNYTYHVGQYLPDWHPWENYQDFFVWDKRTNGCREIFAIELPWILKTFGEIDSFNVMHSKMSSLQIDYDDNFVLMVTHKNGSKGLIACDVISRKPVRNLEVFGENVYLKWDGSPDGLYCYDFQNKKDCKIALYDKVDRKENYASFVIENAYQTELECFIAECQGSKKAKYTFEDDLNTLSLIDRIGA